MRDGTTGRFPHIIERGKPGIIGVLADGQRFCNEGNGYHDYVAAMLRAVPPGQEVASWLVCTRAFQRRYGLGIARPAPLPVEPYIRSGYIKTGRHDRRAGPRTAGSTRPGWSATVAEYNRHARNGRGSRLRPRLDAVQPLPGRSRATGPTPASRRSSAGPFYAVKVVPGSFGTFAGLKTDASARVLDARRRADPGALRGRHRHGERHGRPLSGRRHQSRPGDDLRLHRRPACGRRGRYRTCQLNSRIIASERDVAVLLPRVLDLLVGQPAQRLGDAAAGAVRHDHVVDEAALGGDERVGEALAIFLGAGLDRLAGSPRSARKMISTAPLGPITAISAVGQA